MADAEFTITGRTQVDTSGMKDLADTAKDAKDAIDKITATPDAAPKVDASGVEHVKEAAEEAAEAIDEIDDVQFNFDGMGADQLKARISELETGTANLEKQIIKASEAADNLTTPKGIEDANARIDEMSQRLRPLQQELTAAKLALQDLGAAGSAAPAVQEQQSLTDALHNTTAAADSAAQAVSSIKPPEVAASTDIIPDLNEPAQNAMAALDSLLERYRSMIDVMQQKGALTVIMNDAEGTTMSLADLKDAMQQVIDMQIQLAEGGGLSAGGDMDASIQEIVANYEKEEAAAEKAATKAEQEAEKVIAAYQKQAQQSGQSLDELETALEDYKRKMEEAAKAGDKIGQADAIKGIESTSKQIKTLTTEQNTNARASQTMAQNVGNIIRMMTTGQISARGFSESVRGIGKAIKTGLGPIGWAILLIEALCAVFGKLVDWVKGWGEAAEKEAARAGEAFNKQVEAAKQAEEELKKFREKMDNERGIRGLEDYRLRRTKEVSDEYDEQTRKIEKQLRLTLYGLSDKADRTEHEYDMKAEGIKQQAAAEGWSRQKLSDALENNEISRKTALLAIREEEAVSKLNAAKGQQAEIEKKLAAEKGMLASYKENMGTEDPVTLQRKQEHVEGLIKQYKELAILKELAMTGKMDEAEKIYDQWDGTSGEFWNGINDVQQEQLAKMLGFSDKADFGKDPDEVKRRMKDLRERMKKLDGLPALTDELLQAAAEINMKDIVDGDAVDVDKLGVEYKTRVDGAVGLIKTIDASNKELQAAKEAATQQEQAKNDAGRETEQYGQITKAQKQTKTADRSRETQDYKAKIAQKEAIQKATVKELQDMLKKQEELLAAQGDDTDEAQKIQAQIDKINSQMEKLTKDSEKEQKKREKIASKAKNEAKTVQQGKQIDWVKDQVEGTLSSDATIGEKIQQLGAITQQITKGKSQITDDLLEYVLSGQEQLAEAAKNQKEQASQLATIASQLKTTRAELDAAKKYIKNMPR